MSLNTLIDSIASGLMPSKVFTFLPSTVMAGGVGACEVGIPQFYCLGVVGATAVSDHDNFIERLVALLGLGSLAAGESELHRERVD